MMDDGDKVRIGNLEIYYRDLSRADSPIIWFPADQSHITIAHVGDQVYFEGIDIPDYCDLRLKLPMTRDYIIETRTYLQVNHRVGNRHDGLVTAIRME